MGIEINSGAFNLNGGNTTAEIMQRAFLAPEASRADGRFFIFDLGREEAGLFHMELTCREECDILIGYGEHLDDLRVRTSVGGRNFAFSYRARRGHSEFTHYFKRIAGRYLEAFVTGDGAAIEKIGVIPTEYPLCERGAFECGDSLLNEIYKISVRTLKLCMHEHYEDCPWREQALYGMDSRNQALCGYLAFGEADFAIASLKLMAEGIGPDGLLEICAPARDRITIPSFSLGFVLAVRDMALYTGRLDAARDLMPAVARVLGFFTARLTDGLIETPSGARYWNFYEWQTGLDDGWEYGAEYKNANGNRLDAPINFFFIMALDAAGDICRWTGLTDEYSPLADAIRPAARRAFYDNAKRAYRTYINAPEHYAELTQALAILARLPDGEAPGELRERLAKGEFIETSLSYMLYKYEALMGDTSYAGWILDDMRRVWGRMTLAGATSFWETVDGADAFDKAGSLCHGWSAVPVWVLFTVGAGVRPMTPGYQKFRFEPALDDARARVPAPSGDILINGREASRA